MGKPKTIPKSRHNLTLTKMKKVLLTLAVTCFAFAASAQIVVGGQIGFSTDNGNVNSHTVLSGSGVPGADYDRTWDRPADPYTSFTFMPKIGYNLNEKMQVGAQLGFTLTNQTIYNAVHGLAYTYTYPEAEDWEKISTFEFSIAPYFRYNVAEFGKFTFFCEAQFYFTLTAKPTYTYHATKIEDAVTGFTYDAVDTTFKGNTSRTSFGINITPGLNYKFTDHVSMDIYIDLLGLGFYHSHTNNFIDNNPNNVNGTYTDTEEYNTTSNYFHFTANANAQTVREHLSLFRIGFNYVF